jgi:hypothetical protein
VADERSVALPHVIIGPLPLVLYLYSSLLYSLKDAHMEREKMRILSRVAVIPKVSHNSIVRYAALGRKKAGPGSKLELGVGPKVGARASGPCSALRVRLGQMRVGRVAGSSKWCAHSRAEQTRPFQRRQKSFHHLVPGRLGSLPFFPFPVVVLQYGVQSISFDY